MKIFERWDWEDTYSVCILAIGIVLAVYIFMMIFSDHRIRSYYLDTYNNKLVIRADINWQEDQVIELDRTVSYNEAIDMIERLNKTLIKK